VSPDPGNFELVSFVFPASLTAKSCPFEIEFKTHRTQIKAPGTKIKGRFSRPHRYVTIAAAEGNVLRCSSPIYDD
jgi:hypothetical protein